MVPLTLEKNIQEHKLIERIEIVSRYGLIEKFGVGVVLCSPLELSTIGDYYTASMKKVRGFLHRFCLHTVSGAHFTSDTHENSSIKELRYAEDLKAATVTLSSNSYFFPGCGSVCMILQLRGNTWSRIFSWKQWLPPV